MKHEYSLHLFYSVRAMRFDYRVVLHEQDFQTAVEHAIFAGMRSGDLPNDGSRYTYGIEPLLPRHLHGEATSVSSPGSSIVITGFEIVIESGSSVYAHSFPMTIFSHRVVDIAGETMQGDEAARNCSMLRFRLEAVPDSGPEPSRLGRDVVTGLVVHPPERTLPVYDTKVAPAIAGTDATDRHGNYPIVMRRSVRDAMLLHARRHPEREVAGFLVGNMFRDPNTSEIHAMIEEYIEAEHTEGSRFHVVIGAGSWMAFHARMSGRKESLIGWAHSHPFDWPVAGSDEPEAATVSRISVSHARVPGSEALSAAEKALVVNGNLKHQAVIPTESAAPASYVSSIFLSTEDAFIQRRYFSLPIHIAIVVDPSAADDEAIGVWGWLDGAVVPRSIHITAEDVS